MRCVDKWKNIYQNPPKTTMSILNSRSLNTNYTYINALTDCVSKVNNSAFRVHQFQVLASLAGICRITGSDEKCTRKRI